MQQNRYNKMKKCSICWRWFAQAHSHRLALASLGTISVKLQQAKPTLV
jgi:hypothetical protein